MPKFNIAEAKSRFSELVQKAASGEEIVIARDSKPVAKLVPFSFPKRNGKRQPGSARGKVWMAPDFDATPKDFKDYA